MLEFEDRNNGQSAEIPLGESFDSALRENATTGFRWSVSKSGEPVCALLGDEFNPGAGVGAGGIHRWHFKTAQAGEAEIQLALRRSWEQTSASTFALRVTVKP